MKNTTWLLLLGLVLGLFVLSEGGFLASVLDQPSFTYSSFMYGAETPLAGDVMVSKNYARVGALPLDGDYKVSIGEPVFKCNHDAYLEEHGLMAPQSFSDQCWEYTIFFEDQQFIMKNGDVKTMNPYLKIRFRSEGRVRWEDFKCNYEKDGVIYSQPQTCSFQTLSAPQHNKWVGNLDFYVNTKDGLTMVLENPKANIALNTQQGGVATVTQKVFKKVNGGLRIVHTQEGLYETPSTSMQAAKNDLVLGDNILSFSRPTDKLGVVSTEVAPYINIKSSHVEWTGLGGNITTQETAVRSEAFFKGMTAEQEEFRTERAPSSTNAQEVVGVSEKSSTWKNVTFVILIIGIIALLWYAVLKKR